jgi:hypothetical protein
MAYDNQRIQDAYEAGRDCHRNGPNLVNSHYTWFATPEMKKAWERGKLEGGDDHQDRIEESNAQIEETIQNARIQLDKSKALLNKLTKELSNGIKETA